MDHPTLLCRCCYICPMQQQILFTRSRKQNKYKMIKLKLLPGGYQRANGSSMLAAYD